MSTKSLKSNCDGNQVDLKKEKEKKRVSTYDVRS